MAHNEDENDRLLEGFMFGLRVMRIARETSVEGDPWLILHQVAAGELTTMTGGGELKLNLAYGPSGIQTQDLRTMTRRAALPTC
jgi:hypothetical protein